MRLGIDRTEEHTGLNMNPGTVLNGRYTIDRRLGRGAMGEVYLATDLPTGQPVAIKVIVQNLALEPDLVERFRREGEALRQLRHPNIVGFVDMFQVEGQQCIVMEYVAGGSLHELIKQGPLPVDRVRQTALDLSDALIRAHRLGIIHRDLKPENVLLAPDGTPRLTDFGIARLLGNSGSLTATGMQVGTPYYMSPEAWEGKPLDAQADVWSFGVVLYQMLTGKVPFNGDTMVALMHQVLTAPLPDIRTVRPDVPPGMVAVVGRMLTRDRSVRYPTIRQVSADLERGEASPVGPVPATAGLPQSAALPSSRGRLMPKWAIGGVVAIGLIAILALLVFGYGLVHLAGVPRVTPTFLPIAPTVPPASPQPTSTIQITVPQPSVQIVVVTETPTIRTNSRVSPDDFVRAYVAALNGRQFEQAWGYLSANYKARHNSSGYDDYVKWVNTLGQVDVQSVVIQSQTNDAAAVYTTWVYALNPGTRSETYTVQLVADQSDNSWLIDELTK